MKRRNTVAENLAVVEAHFHSEAANEVDQALSLYTDNVVWESPTRGIVLQGKEAAARNYSKMFRSMADRKVTPLRRFATADQVVDESILRFRLVDDGMTNAPLPVGSDVELRMVHIFEMHDRSIAREVVYEIWHEATNTRR